MNGTTDEILANLAESWRAGDVWRSFVVEQRALLDELPAMLDHVAEITTPAVVVAGTRDRVTPLSSATALVAALPHAELVEVAGGGHQLPRTHPNVVADAVRSLLTP
jgi:pimeloyl-ACP methyl ester carboxylesterase